MRKVQIIIVLTLLTLSAVLFWQGYRLLEQYNNAMRPHLGDLYPEQRLAWAATLRPRIASYVIVGISLIAAVAIAVVGSPSLP